MTDEIQLYTTCFVIVAALMLVITFLLSPVNKENRAKEITFRIGVAMCLSGAWVITCFGIVHTLEYFL